MCFTAIRKGSNVIVWNWIPSGKDPTLAFTCALSPAKTYDLIRLQRMSVSTNESQSVGRKWNAAVIYGFGWHLTKCHVSVLLLLRGASVCTYNFPSFRFSNFAILANITKQGAQTFQVFMGDFTKHFSFNPPEHVFTFVTGCLEMEGRASGWERCGSPLLCCNCLVNQLTVMEANYWMFSCAI